MDEIKLKPCPFCGGAGEVVQESSFKSAHCTNKDCEMFYTHVAIGLKPGDWQSRPIEASLRSLIGELVESISNARDLARTGVAPEALGMTQEDWMRHKLIKISGELDSLMAKVKEVLG